MKSICVTALGLERRDVSELGEESTEKVGGSLLSEAMGIDCDVGLSDCRQSPENMRWTIASKSHPAKVEPPPR